MKALKIVSHENKCWKASCVQGFHGWQWGCPSPKQTEGMTLGADQTTEQDGDCKCENMEFTGLQLSSAPLPSMPMVSSLLLLSSPVGLTIFPMAKLTWLLNTKFITLMERTVFFSSTPLGRFMFSLTWILFFFLFLFHCLGERKENLWCWYSKRSTAWFWFWLVPKDSSFYLQVLPSQTPR